MRHHPGRRLLFALVAVVTAGAAGGIAYATGAIGSTDPVAVVACVANSGGAVRVVSVASQCTKKEHALLLQQWVAPAPTAFTVDCAAGQKIQDVLDQLTNSTQPVTIEVKGVCDEDVSIGRDNVKLAAASPGAGANGIVLAEVRGIGLSGLAIGAGGLRASAATFHASNIDVNGDMGVLLDSGAVGFLDNATVENATQTGVQLRDNSSLNMNGGAVTGSSLTGITVSGGHANVSNVRIADNGTGVEVQFGGSANISNCLIEQNDFVGVHIFDGAEASVGSSTLQGNARGGANAQSGDLNLSGVEVRDNYMVGVIGMNGARLTLQGGTVVESNHGTGLLLQSGSSAEIQGADVIRQNDGNGVLLQDNSVISSSVAAQVVDNGGWGFWCEGTPANALIRGFGGGVGTVTGNGAGQVGCQVIPS